MKKILTATLLIAISLLINSCGKNGNTTNTLDPSNSCVLKVSCGAREDLWSKIEVRITLKYQDGKIYNTTTQFKDGEYIVPKGGSIDVSASGTYYDKGYLHNGFYEEKKTFMVGDLNLRTLRINFDTYANLSVKIE